MRPLLVWSWKLSAGCQLGQNPAFGVHQLEAIGPDDFRGLWNHVATSHLRRASAR
jgi:hypothetical protein